MNYLLKFKHSNGSNVWFTVYCSNMELWLIANDIEIRTAFKFTGDYTELGAE